MGADLQSYAWPTVTLGLAEWTAQIVYLVPLTMPSGDMAIGLELGIHLHMNTTGNEYFFGTGITQTGVVDVPLDGPVRSTVLVRGISQLEHVGP
jgi:hypothetical protein